MGLIIGFDPGLKGGMASVHKGSVDACCRMPVIKDGTKSILDLNEIASKLRDIASQIDLIVIEKVHAMPKQGVTSVFTFGEGYGSIKGIAAGLAIPIIEVTPQRWMKDILNGIPLDLGKKRSLAYCKARFPNLGKITDGESDALCIALWGEQKNMF